MLARVYNVSGSLLYNSYWHTTFMKSHAAFSKQAVRIVRTVRVTIKIHVYRESAKVWVAHRNSSVRITRCNDQLSNSVRWGHILLLLSRLTWSHALKTGSRVVSAFKWTLAHFCLSFFRLQADSLAMTSVLRPTRSQPSDKLRCCVNCVSKKRIWRTATEHTACQRAWRIHKHVLCHYNCRKIDWLTFGSSPKGAHTRTSLAREFASGSLTREPCSDIYV
jgi:hypothetical protein